MDMTTVDDRRRITKLFQLESIDGVYISFIESCIAPIPGLEILGFAPPLIFEIKRLLSRAQQSSESIF